MPNMIDVGDLTDEQVKALEKLIELFRRQGKKKRVTKAATKEEKVVFASWPLGVKGKLTRKEIYDNF